MRRPTGTWSDHGRREDPGQGRQLDDVHVHGQGRRKGALRQHARGELRDYSMRADGTGVTRLTNNKTVDTAPEWSRDHAKIAFSTNRDGNTEIYVMKANGSGQTRLT